MKALVIAVSLLLAALAPATADPRDDIAATRGAIMALLDGQSAWSTREAATRTVSVQLRANAVGWFRRYEDALGRALWQDWRRFEVAYYRALSALDEYAQRYDPDTADGLALRAALENGLLQLRLIDRQAQVLLMQDLDRMVEAGLLADEGQRLAGAAEHPGADFHALRQRADRYAVRARQAYEFARHPDYARLGAVRVFPAYDAIAPAGPSLAALWEPFAEDIAAGRIDRDQAVRDLLTLMELDTSVPPALRDGTRRLQDALDRESRRGDDPLSRIYSLPDGPARDQAARDAETELITELALLAPDMARALDAGDERDVAYFTRRAADIAARLGLLVRNAGHPLSPRDELARGLAALLLAERILDQRGIRDNTLSETLSAIRGLPGITRLAPIVVAPYAPQVGVLARWLDRTRAMWESGTTVMDALPGMMDREPGAIARGIEARRRLIEQSDPQGFARDLAEGGLMGWARGAPILGGLLRLFGV